jgi:hypothetical protein
MTKMIIEKNAPFIQHFLSGTISFKMSNGRVSPPIFKHSPEGRVFSPSETLIIAAVAELSAAGC